MKKTLLLLLPLIFYGLATHQAEAQSNELGIILGEPTGLSAKFWTGGNTAVDLGVAWSLGESGSMHLHSNYLHHLWLNSSSAFYLGLGGRMLINSSSEFAARVPLGVQINTARGRLALFLEMAPTMGLIPDTDSNFFMNGGLGIRFRF